MKKRDDRHLRMKDACLLATAGALFLDDRSREAMIAASGIPLTCLLGEAPSGLFTDGDVLEARKARKARKGK